MLYLYTGTDREKVRAEIDKRIGKLRKDVEIVRVTDANTIADAEAALRGAGMFGGVRAIVFQDTFSNEEMAGIVSKSLKHMSDSDETFFIFEEKIDAATRKHIERFAEESERFDAKKGSEKRGDVFQMAYAMNRGDKKALWVDYMRALSRDEAPEAIHGVLFWGAKQAVLRGGAAEGRAAHLLAALAELPHESRRHGVELEYALERFILNIG